MPLRRCRSALLAAGIAAAMMTGAATAAWAQVTGTIRGTVVDRVTGRPLAGADIGVASSNIRNSTDEQGRFMIPRVPTGSQTVRALMIGYTRIEATVTVMAGQEATVDLRLSPAVMQLDEVVITGQPGRTEKRALGNSVSSLKAAEIAEAGVIPDLQALLTGRTPGLTVIANSGQAGAGTNVRIRGAGSLSAGYQPVYYIDGIRFEANLQTGFGTGNSTVQATSPFSFLNPNDIESVELVKGPAAATLYGADAAGGVIQVITKKGRRGAGVQWSFGGEVGESEWTNHIGNPVNYWLCKDADIRDPVGFPGCVGEDSLAAAATRLFVHNPLREDTAILAEGNGFTYGRLAALRVGKLYRYDISARGGGDFFNYYLSFDRNHEEGVYYNNFDGRTGGRANFEFTPSEKVDIGLSFGYARNQGRQPLQDNSSNGILRNGLRGRTSAAASNWRPGWRGFSPELSNDYDNQTRAERTTVGLTANYRPFRWFQNRLTLGMDKQDRKNTVFFKKDETGRQPWGAVTATGTISHFIPITHIYTVDYAGTVNFNIKPDLSSAFSAGMQLNARERRSTDAVGEGLIHNSLNLVGSAAVTRADEDYTKQTSLGFYVQEQVAWRERLYVTGAVRVDDNSAFGKDFSLVVYPKASVSWVISDESFFNVPIVDQLKLRVAWGQAGNAPAPFSADRTFTSTVTTINDVSVNQLTPSSFGNPNLKAETGDEIEAGFEASLLGDRVGLDFTYYNKQTKDALINVPNPPSSGFSGSHLENVGQISNTGIEVTLNTKPVNGRNLSWDAALLFSTNNNKLVDFGATLDDITFGAFADVQRHVEGYPLGAFWYVDVQRDASGNLIRDVNGIAVVNITDFQYAGPSTPSREAAFTNTFTLFGNLRLYAHMDYKGGFKAWCALCSVRNRIDQNTWEVNDPAVWEGVDPDDPAQIPEQIAIWKSLQTRTHIFEGDFVKLRELSLTYTLPASWSRALRANRVSLTVAGRNLRRWTKYKGIGDPEGNFSATSAFTRLDYATTPPVQQLMASMRITF